MPKRDEDLDRLAALGVQIEQAEHEILQAEWRLEQLREELAAAAIAYAAKQAKREAEPEEPRPWADGDLSAPDRVRAFFEARPHSQVNAQQLIDAGIDVKIENLRSTLHRMQEGGELRRVSKGVYALAQPTKEETDA